MCIPRMRDIPLIGNRGAMYFALVPLLCAPGISLKAQNVDVTNRLVIESGQGTAND
jgi:hypothetical protein